MAEIDQTSQELFFKLRNRFPKIRMGDGDGKSTGNPTDARFFNITYDTDGAEHGDITLSLVDGESLKVYFSQDMTDDMEDESQDRWFDFLRELRRFAKTNLLTFDVRDINKHGLTQEDIRFSSEMHKDKSGVNESKITWQRRGRFSEGNQKNVRIHVVHKNRMDENPNNRLVQVDKIFLVNENNERFLLPFTSVMGAKAMANHVNRGGTPYDGAGQTINKVVAEMKNLSRFQMATRNKTFESQDPYRVIRATQLVKEEMKKHLKRLGGERHFEESLAALQEMIKEDTPQTDAIKNYFIQQYYNESLDAWLGSAAMAYKRCEDNNMDLNQDIPLTEEEDDALPSKDQTDIRAANPAKIGGSIELYANPQTDAEMRKLIRSQPLRGMVGLILSDIASRAVDDETAILASKADEGEFTVAHKKMIEAYLKDLFGENPPRKGESERRTINHPKKRRSAEEEFESAIMGIGEPEMEEDEEMEAIGDKDPRARFRSLKKIKGRFREGDNVPMPPPRPVPTPPARPKDLGKSNSQYSSDRVDDEPEDIGRTGMRTIQEEGCNHTMEGEYCPVHGMNECGSGMYEQELDELSPETLGSYINKAGSSMAQSAYKLGINHGDEASQDPALHKTIGNRAAGIKLATDKLMPTLGVGNDVDEDSDNVRRRTNEDITDLRKLAGLAECGCGGDMMDDMMGDGMTGGWLVMGQPHDTAAVQRDSAEMDRAKRLEQAILDKAHADAEAQTNWIIDQIRKAPVWSPPGLEKEEAKIEEVGAAQPSAGEGEKPSMSADHPHADQQQPQASMNDEEVEEEAEETEEGNAFTGALAKTEKGSEFELDGKRYTDTSDHDAEEDDEEEESEDEETEESRQFFENMMDLRKLAGLKEQETTSMSPSNRDPLGQGLANVTTSQWNRQAAANRAAEKAFYDANPHLVGDTETMQKLRDQDKINFNPGTLSKSFDDQGVDPTFAANRSAVDAAKRQRYQAVDTAKTADAISKIQNAPAWTPDSQPWPDAKPTATASAAPSTPAPSKPDASVDDMKASLSDKLGRWEQNKSTIDQAQTAKSMFGGGLKESDSINLLRKLSGL